jgi:hypothetical protein
MSSFEEKYELLVGLLAVIVKDGVYTPFDKIIRAIDRDTVMASLYDAMRYIAPDLRRCSEYFACYHSSDESRRKECLDKYSTPDYKRCREIGEVLKDPSKLIEGLRVLDELIEEISKGSLTKVKKIAMLAVRRGMDLTLREYVKSVAGTTAS